MRLKGELESESASLRHVCCCRVPIHAAFSNSSTDDEFINAAWRREDLETIPCIGAKISWSIWALRARFGRAEEISSKDSFADYFTCYCSPVSKVDHSLGLRIIDCRVPTDVWAFDVWVRVQSPRLNGRTRVGLRASCSCEISFKISCIMLSTETKPTDLCVSGRCIRCNGAKCPVEYQSIQTNSSCRCWIGNSRQTENTRRLVSRCSGNSWKLYRLCSCSLYCPSR